MQTEENERLHKIEPGQLWKLEHGYLHIVESGKRLIYYKRLKAPEQRVAITQMISIEALLNYLRQSEAQLVA
jgi:hypothetical protein